MFYLFQWCLQRWFSHLSCVFSGVFWWCYGLIGVHFNQDLVEGIGVRKDFHLKPALRLSSWGGRWTNEGSEHPHTRQIPHVLSILHTVKEWVLMDVITASVALQEALVCTTVAAASTQVKKKNSKRWCRKWICRQNSFTIVLRFAVFFFLSLFLGCHKHGNLRNLKRNLNLKRNQEESECKRSINFRSMPTSTAYFTICGSRDREVSRFLNSPIIVQTGLFEGVFIVQVMSPRVLLLKFWFHSCSSGSSGRHWGSQEVEVTKLFNKL